MLIDGEVAVAHANGRTDFASLQKSLENGVAKGVSYFAFDLLAEGAKDLRKLALETRKARLEHVLGKAKAPIRLSPYFEGGGPDVLEAFKEKGLEGMVSKKASASYPSGRSNAWVKVKLVNEQEFVVIGYQPSARGRAFASLMLAEGLKRRAASRTLERAVDQVAGSPRSVAHDTRSFTDAVIDLLPQARTDVEHYDEVWR